MYINKGSCGCWVGISCSYRTLGHSYRKILRFLFYRLLLIVSLNISVQSRSLTGLVQSFLTGSNLIVSVTFWGATLMQSPFFHKLIICFSCFVLNVPKKQDIIIITKSVFSASSLNSLLRRIITLHVFMAVHWSDQCISFHFTLRHKCIGSGYFPLCNCNPYAYTVNSCKLLRYTDILIIWFEHLILYLKINHLSGMGSWWTFMEFSNVNICLYDFFLKKS